MEVSYGGKLAMIHSKSSKPYISFVFVDTKFWKIPRMDSIWLFCTIWVGARGMRAERRRTRAGTLPLDVHKLGLSMGAINIVNSSESGPDVFVSRRAAKS